MADGTGDRPRYHAFISYSHRDAAFGRRLHRRLEGYRLPRRLVGRPGRHGPAPARLSPIFRDREELPAAGDLSAEVRAALAASAALVVVCSPSAAASPWVGREIETFRALHPDRPILAAVVQGEPADCFPEALSVGGIEPLAADFRKAGDGPRLGLLKLAAGIAGVGLDELVQRDAQRQVASVTAITAGALTLTLVMAAMTAVALDARAEAERQRAQAEGLVDFMLTDLRDRLEGVGRLGIMRDVNARALAHYGDDLERMTPDQQAQRAAIFHAMGEDNMTAGNLDEALKQFEEAWRTTATLLAAEPDNAERIFGHAQSEFWVARIAYERKQYGPARAGFLKYRAMAGQMVRIEPRSAKYLQEVGFAEGALCSLVGKESGDMVAALRHCQAALTAMEAAMKADPGKVEIVRGVLNRHGWLADIHKANHDYDRALEHRLTQERLLGGLMAADPDNAELKRTWITVQLALAIIEANTGQKEAARTRLGTARTRVAELTKLDPENAVWRKASVAIDEQYAQID